jgi:hypothetical protein
MFFSFHKLVVRWKRKGTEGLPHIPVFVASCKKHFNSTPRISAELRGPSSLLPLLKFSLITA